VLGVNTAKTYLSGASADTEPKNVLAKPSEEGKSATISWVSDKPTTGVVEYGTTPASLLLRAPESDSTSSHAVTLSPLKANTNYYFRIRIGEEVFDNNGIPYSFKTKAAEVEVVPTVAVVPTVVSSNTGGCQTGVDYDKNGTINSLDMLSCVRNGASATPANEKCPVDVDYDKNGVVNSLDRIKCLQATKL